MALLVGVSILAAGWLAARALTVAQRERLLRAAGAATGGRSERKTASGRLARRAARLGWRGGPGTYLGLHAAAGVAAALWGWRTMGPVGAAVGAIGGPLGVDWTLSARARRGRERIEVQVREAVVALASAVRAGRSIRGAVEEAVREVDDPLRLHLGRVVSRLEVGEPVDAALASLRDLEAPDVHLLLTLLEVHGRSGGDLPAMLDEVARIMGHRVEARRGLRALTAQGRASGAVLALLPIAFVTLLSWTGGNGLGAFYRTGLGVGLLIAGLACDAAGFLWVRRIVRSRWAR
jgi:tight adherence protein B